tara:strand:+ start:279 stop:830 length:552 start_codon:yes stop_codon:yes gene_type:complete
VANNNYPQITSVTSEALQAQIRALLPSQEGFGTDLMAQNVIVPVIDLTSAATGAAYNQNLLEALAFGSQTAFEINNTTTVLANSPGFWRVTAGYTNFNNTSGDINCALSMSDGLSTKTVWKNRLSITSPAVQVNGGDIDFIFFLAAGESISGTASIYSYLAGSYRQIADVNGVVVNPIGFSPQ